MSTQAVHLQQNLTFANSAEDRRSLRAASR
jgi:hypothetical protein